MIKHDTVNAPAANSRPAVVSAGEHAVGGRSERSGSRFEAPEIFPSLGHEEILVIDDRAALRPAQVVESKLTRLLEQASLPASHLQMRGLLRTRLSN